MRKHVFPVAAFSFQQIVLMSQEILSSKGIIPLFYILSIQSSPPPYSFAWLYVSLPGFFLLLCIPARNKALCLFHIVQEFSNYCRICRWFSQSWDDDFLVIKKPCCYFFPSSYYLYIQKHITCLRLVLIGKNSTNARSDFVHGYFFFHSFFFLCVCKYLHVHRKHRLANSIFFQVLILKDATVMFSVIHVGLES